MFDSGIFLGATNALHLNVKAGMNFFNIKSLLPGAFIEAPANHVLNSKRS